MLSYLSPTSISLYYEDPKEFYMRYICPESPPRPPQTAPMSAGSAFDAFIKSYLHDNLFGKTHVDSNKFDLRTLFEAQVESQLRDKAWEVGQYLFNKYKKSGALSDLMIELSGAISEPRFELEVKGVVEGYREGVTKDVKGVTLLGKPDIFYINKYGAHVILDWKVNGFYGRYNLSPMQGYVRLRSPQVNPNYYKTESCHPRCQSLAYKGITINAAGYLENFNDNWANQLGIYAFLCGCPIGSDFIVAIDQLCCNGTRLGTEGYPEIRIAEHRLRIHPEYQYHILAKAQTVWEIIHSDYYFRDMTLEESKEKCKLLDEVARKMNSKNISEEDHWMLEVSRK